MAGIEVRGFEELRKNTEHLSRVVADEAIRAAEDAAAAVFKAAVTAAAPVRTGSLKRATIVYECVDRKALTGSNRRRLLVGPDKRKGFYGYFYEMGRKGQPARPYFAAAAAGVEQTAHDAGVAAFEAVVNSALDGMK